MWNYRFKVFLGVSEHVRVYFTGIMLLISICVLEEGFNTFPLTIVEALVLPKGIGIIGR